MPKVTDELPVAIRAFAGPTYTVLPDVDNASSKQIMTEPAPASEWTLIFDCETMTDPGQSLRFGAYQFRKGNELDEAGIFYDPDGVSEAELITLQCYAEGHGQLLRSREEFVDQVFYARAFALRATIVGFNLPFDISRLAFKWGSGRTWANKDAGGMRGAFTFKLSRQKIYLNVKIKHRSQKAASISFAGPIRPADGRGHRKRKITTPIRRGHFIDVKTLSNALFARGFSLKSLSAFLEVPNPKLDFDDFDGPISDDMVGYAVRDVQATWECFAELMTRFNKLKLSRTLPEKVYSEASIGKGYIREMGITPWRKIQPDFPRHMFAKIMGSYFGGRSEVRIRRDIRQVILCDFLSMYATVCTLMGLWQFVIAEGMTWCDTTAATRSLLDLFDLAALQSPESWTQLATLVRVLPDADIFPVRAGYSSEAQTTIGANFLSSECSLWFTLADCIAAKLLTGKAPQILEAMTFTPGPVQAGLQPVNIAGNPDYCVDPNSTDFFKRVIEMRQSVKSRMKEATGKERARLDTEQNSLKICASSTSYGIWVEVNVAEMSAPSSVTVHSSTCEPFSFKTDKAEEPGTYFHPLLATLITGAARLMLAITERLVTDKGLDWSFCDTDSMAIARPDELPANKFSAKVAEVVEWFTALNPYEFGGSILKVEDVNGSLETGEPEPLHCLAISSKRYALFNLAADGSPIMRKVSAHGLGHLLPPYNAANAPANLPTPDKSVLGQGSERWHCDLWHRIVTANIAGHPDQVPLDYHPALSKPAISRYTATSPELLRWFKIYNATRDYRDQVKPFNFLLSMTEGFRPGSEQLVATVKRGRRKKPARMKPVSPFETDHDKAIALAFDRNTGQHAPASALKTYGEALAQYHLSPESKFLNADYLDRGTTIRRHVLMSGTRHIGKESHDWERQAVLGMNADSEVAYGVSADYLAERLQAFSLEFGEVKAAKALGISTARLMALASGPPSPGAEKLALRVASRLPGAVRLCTKLRQGRYIELQGLEEAVKREGLRTTARRLGIDPSNLRRKLHKLSTYSDFDLSGIN